MTNVSVAMFCAVVSVLAIKTWEMILYAESNEWNGGIHLNQGNRIKKEVHFEVSKIRIAFDTK